MAAGGLAAVAALLGGCAGLEADDVGTVARVFEDASGDPAQRCELLAPATRAALESDESAPCADALEQIPLQGGTVESVEVWGRDAQVRLSGDTVFLTESHAGWLVTAAACQRRGEAPYDCEVDGP
ncbi:hypothetical protein [Geodermatophilus sp. SYSU D00708]